MSKSSFRALTLLSMSLVLALVVQGVNNADLPGGSCTDTPPPSSCSLRWQPACFGAGGCTSASVPIGDTCTCVNKINSTAECQCWWAQSI